MPTPFAPATIQRTGDSPLPDTPTSPLRLPPDGRYAFRPVAATDLPLLSKWLSRPHLREWWGNPAEELAEIEEILATPHVDAFLVLLDGRPIGYIQAYSLDAEPDHPYQPQPAGTWGIDQSIGEPDLMGQGHGSAFVRLFAEKLFADGATRIVTDPDRQNARAIRAYEKAGFSPVGPRSSIYGEVLLMARDADR